MVAELDGQVPVSCQTCGRAVGSKAFMHLHIESEGVCNYLCLGCFSTVIAWASVAAMQDAADEAAESR